MKRLLVLLFLVACSRDAIDTPAAARTPAAVSDELLAALEKAQALHHQADAELAAGRLDVAILRVEEVLRVAFPEGASEAEDVAVDARARLAKLYQSAGRLADAERVADEGLAVGKRDTFFLANLWRVRGELHEARARELDGEAARSTLRQAITAYARGQDINLRVQARVYEETLP